MKTSPEILDDTRRREIEALDRAVAIFGSKSELGRQLDVTPQGVEAWFKDGVPPRRCPQIEILTQGQVQCEELREDYKEYDHRPFRRLPAVAMPAEAE